MALLASLAGWPGALATPASAHSGTVSARLELGSTPAAGQPATLTVLMADDFQFPAIGATVQARAEGPARVRGVRLLEQAEGVYTGQMTFPEAGDWQILLDVEFADEEHARGALPLRVAAAGDPPGRPQRPQVALQPYAPAPWGRIGLQAAVSAVFFAAVVGVVEWTRRRRGG